MVEQGLNFNPVFQPQRGTRSTKEKSWFIFASFALFCGYFLRNWALSFSIKVIK
jgi:hypothetical protein